MPARFHDNDVQSRLKNRRKLSAYLDSVIKAHLPGVKKISLDYIFCTDAYLLQMNEEFLKHDTFTDIITFDLSEAGNDVTGEIYVSTERVAENAAKFGVRYNDELHRVIFHGALHLCGFKDKKPAEQQLMRQQEDKCLAGYKQAAN